MILHDSEPRPSFIEYGIDIPILGSNAQKTVEKLLAIPAFHQRKAEWLIEKPLGEVTREQIERVHDREYVERLFGDGCDDEIVRTYELVNADGTFHRYDPDKARIPLRSLFSRARRNAQGTVEGAHIAYKSGFCFYLGGGMHHGKSDYGEGFCLINDIVIAAKDIQVTTGVETVWVIDVDAHKGDGTAALTADDPTIVTFSQHMAAGWPLDQPEVFADGRPNPSYTPSDIDVPIAEGEDDRYLLALRLGLDQLKRYPKAGLAIVLAGSDPYDRDELPSARLLQLPSAQMLQRDLLIDAFLRKEGVPVLYVMAGNYGPNSWEVYTRFLTHILTRRLTA